MCVNLFIHFYPNSVGGVLFTRLIWIIKKIVLMENSTGFAILAIKWRNRLVKLIESRVGIHPSVSWRLSLFLSLNFDSLHKNPTNSLSSVTKRYSLATLDIYLVLNSRFLIYRLVDSLSHTSNEEGTILILDLGELCRVDTVSQLLVTFLRDRCTLLPSQCSR